MDDKMKRKRKKRKELVLLPSLRDIKGALRI